MFARLTALLLSLTAWTAAHGQSAGVWQPTGGSERSSGHGIRHLEKRFKQGSHPREITVQLLIPDRARTRLKVVEVAPDQSVAAALEKAGALAGVNGGYFHKDRRPLGLVVMDGKESHGLERSKLLSGVVEITPRHAKLLRRTEFKKTAQLKEALQAGPYLVDKASTVPGLNAQRAAERTVLLADKKGIVALATVSPMTLAECSRLLATPGLFPELPPIERALNLDGGSSTAIWVGDHAPLKAFSQSEWKRVINALAVVPK